MASSGRSHHQSNPLRTRLAPKPPETNEKATFRAVKKSLALMLSTLQPNLITFIRLVPCLAYFWSRPEISARHGLGAFLAIGKRGSDNGGGDIFPDKSAGPGGVAKRSG